MLEPKLKSRMPNMLLEAAIDGAGFYAFRDACWDKLLLAREKDGKCGWYWNDDPSDLYARALDHLHNIQKKEDLLDTANYLMFLYNIMNTNPHLKFYFHSNPETNITEIQK